MQGEIDYSGIPEHMREAMRAYLERGEFYGDDFLQAILEDRLVAAFAAADEINGAAMKAWATFLYNRVPMAARGSREKVLAWCTRGGLNGVAKTEGAKRA